MNEKSHLTQSFVRLNLNVVLFIERKEKKKKKKISVSQTELTVLCNSYVLVFFPLHLILFELN